MKCSFASVSKTEIAYYLNLFNVIHFDPCRTLILINSCFLMFSHSFTMSSTGLWQKASLVSPFEQHHVETPWPATLERGVGSSNRSGAIQSPFGTGSFASRMFVGWGPGLFQLINAKNRHKTLVTRGLNSLRRRWREKERERERERGDLFFNDPNSCESRMGRTLEEKHWETDHFSASWCHRNMWAMRGPFQVKA